MPRELPDLDSCGLFTASELQEATSNPVLRKMVLRSYRHDVVKPLLLDLDKQHLMESIIEPVPTFGFSLVDLGFYEVRLEWEMFDHASVQTSHFNFRAWSLARITGRWPLPLLGKAELPQHIACPACGRERCFSAAHVRRMLRHATPLQEFSSSGPLQKFEAGSFASSLRRSLHVAGLARICRILSSKTVCGQLVECNRLKITCCANGDR